jgi:hypothetical protein
VSIARNALTMSPRGVVALKLTCPASEPAGCTNGMLSLTTAGKVTAARKKKLALGSKGFAIAAGKSTLVKVKLKGRAKRTVLKLRHLRVLALAAADDQARNRRTSSATFTLKAPRKR